jgi:hypothetical protein
MMNKFLQSLRNEESMRKFSIPYYCLTDAQAREVDETLKFIWGDQYQWIPADDSIG